MTDGGERLRWGIVGTGGIAGRFAADVALLDDQWVTAVGSRSAESADRFGAEWAVEHRHPSYEALVHDDTVDAVYVATPHPYHAEHALLAIGAGKPVLVEKPFTMDAASARTVVEAARANGVFAMEAMWTRFLPHMQEIRELLGAGELGDVVALGADQGLRFEPDPKHRLFAPELGGGALLDLGIYPFSFASMVLGTPLAVRACATPTATGVDLTTSAVLVYADGPHAVLTCTAGAVTPMRAWISGTRGRIEIDRPWYAPASFTYTRSEGRRDGASRRFDSPPGIAIGTAKGMRYEALEVARCLHAGLRESPVMPLDETVAILGTLDEVRDQIGLAYPAA
jgi:predicted dehydrogenase